jgi:hypothetical protein
VEQIVRILEDERPLLLCLGTYTDAEGENQGTAAKTIKTCLDGEKQNLFFFNARQIMFSTNLGKVSNVLKRENPDEDNGISVLMRLKRDFLIMMVKYRRSFFNGHSKMVIMVLSKSAARHLHPERNAQYSRKLKDAGVVVVQRMNDIKELPTKLLEKQDGDAILFQTWRHPCTWSIDAREIPTERHLIQRALHMAETDDQRTIASRIEASNHVLLRLTDEAIKRRENTLVQEENTLKKRHPQEVPLSSLTKCRPRQRPLDHEPRERQDVPASVKYQELHGGALSVAKPSMRAPGPPTPAPLVNPPRSGL